MSSSRLISYSFLDQTAVLCFSALKWSLQGRTETLLLKEQDKLPMQLLWSSPPVLSLLGVDLKWSLMETLDGECSDSGVVMLKASHVTMSEIYIVTENCIE